MKFIITESQKKELVKKYLKEQDDSSDNKGGLKIKDLAKQAMDYAKSLMSNSEFESLRASPIRLSFAFLLSRLARDANSDETNLW